MPNINITVREKIAHTISDTCIVCGNSDYVAIFDFDAEWDAYEVKTARFIWGGTFTDVPFTGNECPVPVILDAVSVLVGVYAGELHTTTAAAVGVRRSILGGSETEAEVSHEIKDAFGKMLAGKIDAPQVAQVGEVLTVEEVGEDGKPIKWKTQTVETAPPDWMENDSNNPGFVKNRTHYKQMMTGSAGNPGYKVNLLDGTHRVGDIILLQSCTTTLLQKFLMRGINSPDWDVYELCMLIKETDSNDKTYNLEVICKDRENIVEVNTLSEGNIKVLYSEQKKAFLAYYFISNLSTLSTDDKTKFTQTGVYVQLAGNDYSEYAELWATYRLYVYTKLSNKYLNIKQNPPIPQPWRENEMIATEKTGENEFGYTLRPIPTINDFIDLGITAAQVGQIIKVKAVDDFGNPHEWEAVDMKQICCPQKTTKECGESETITLADNAEYRLTNVTALTFAYPENDFECWIRLTITESGDVAVVFPEGTKYIGSAPTFANDEMWEISIKDGVVIAQKVGDGT